MKEEAFAYAHKGLYEVAEQIIRDGFSSDDFDEGTLLWKRREKFVQQFKTAPLAAMMKKEQEAKEVKLKREREEQREELAQRKKDFIASKNAMEPKPLLGPYDLINWPLRSRGRSWELEDVDGKGVLKAKPKSGGGNWDLGPYGVDWEDYSLSFKVKVNAGKMVFYPRINLSRASRGMMGGSNLDLSDLAETVVFDSSTHGSEWLDVTIEVYGGGDETVVELQISGGDNAGTTQYKGKDLKSKDTEEAYTSTGSFLMVMCEESNIELKDVKLKLVRRRRKGILD